LKQADALPPLLSNFALEYAFRRVEENQGGLKLNRTQKHLAYADNINIVEENTDNKKKIQKLYHTLVRMLVWR
jgi:hypothetical protein